MAITRRRPQMSEPIIACAHHQTTRLEDREERGKDQMRTRLSMSSPLAALTAVITEFLRQLISSEASPQSLLDTRGKTRGEKTQTTNGFVLKSSSKAASNNVRHLKRESEKQFAVQAELTCDRRPTPHEYICHCRKGTRLSRSPAADKSYRRADSLKYHCNRVPN